jgi:cytochrome c-type biogenesis protein CcmE
LTSVHNGLEKRNWTERRKRVILQALAVVFVIIGAVYMLFALGQYISLVSYPNDPTFKEL